MKKVNDTPTMALAMLHSSRLQRAFNRLARNWRRVDTSVGKGWRLGYPELKATGLWLVERIGGLHRAIDGEERGADDVLNLGGPLGELWAVLLRDVTPGTKMWAEMWKGKPHMQRLTISDLLIALAVVKLVRAAMLIQRAYATGDDGAGGIPPETALALAEAQVLDAEEALRVSRSERA